MDSLFFRCRDLVRCALAASVRALPVYHGVLGWAVVLATLPAGAVAASAPGTVAPPPARSAQVAARAETEGHWRFTGDLGRRIDTVLWARVRDPAAWAQNYPETEDAFRRQQDDAAYPRSGQWRGEFWGKYLLSAIAAQRYYDDAALHTRIATAVSGLYSAQAPNGYLGTYRHSDFFGPGTWNIWCRKYTLWGLVEAWRLLGDEAALKAARRVADHLASEVGPGHAALIGTGQFQGLPSTSILTPMVELYRATRERRYLDYARYIADQWARHPSGLPDLWRRGLAGEPIHTWPGAPVREWAKSYEFMSCVEGLVLLYEETGDKTMLAAAKQLHRLIATWERSPVGSVSLNDKFVGSRHLLNTVGELCDVVYWNRLSWALFRVTKDPAYLEEIERAFYNALACGMKPDGTWGLRRLRLTHEHVPAHPHFFAHHQCCVDNLPRGLLQAAEAAWWADRDGLYLGLFAAGEGEAQLPRLGRVRLAVQGDFLADQPLVISVEPERPMEFTLRLRRPSWGELAELRINGVPTRVESVSGPGWIALTRKWRAGDRLDVQLRVPVRTEAFDPRPMAQEAEVRAWAEQEWGSLGVIETDPATKKNRQRKTITAADALPHQAAVVFCKGPLVLARDARLAPVDFRATVAPPPATLPPASLVARSAPSGIARAWRLTLPDRTVLDLCDFASAGNTWDAQSRFAAWQLVATAAK